jgi:hypothetical protein
MNRMQREEAEVAIMIGEPLMERCNRFSGSRPLVCPVGAVDFVGC